MAYAPPIFLLFATAVLCPWSAAQRAAQRIESAPPEDASTLARALVNWAVAFDDGDLEIGETPDRTSERVYENIFIDGYDVPGRGRETTHMGILQELLFQVERAPSVELAWAVLHLAATGFERSLFDPEVLQVRDLGHWTLMRMEREEVWAFLFDVASGKPGQWAPDLQPQNVPPAQQAAAIRLLGAENRTVFRVPVESGLLSTDPRIRLAASEALEQMRRPESLAVVTRAVVSERHPVVSQALVRTLQRLLAVGESDEGLRTRNVESALRILGRTGWRADMGLVELAAEHPSKSVILPLIDLLGREEEDELVRAVNEEASPRLKHRAWEVLCQLTGARISEDDPAAWREFWDREQHNIEIVKRPKPQSMTRATFYGIPVTGQEIAFVIDTSQSMNTLVDKPVEVSARTRTTSSRRAGTNANRWSRLDAAKAQLVLAVQSMDTGSRYHLITFSDTVLTWSRRAVRVTAESHRSLIGVLGRFRAVGSTNIYGALFEGLGADRAVFGQQSSYTVDELFLLSDGEPTAGQVEDTESIIRLVREMNRYQNIRINTVFTGSGRGADFLRRLAEENGGVFVQR